MPQPWEADPIVGEAPPAPAAAPSDQPWATDAPVDASTDANNNQTPSELTPEQQKRDQDFLATNPTPEQYARFVNELQGGTGQGDVEGAKARLDAYHSGALYSGKIGAVGQFFDNLQNDVAGIAQGAASLPDMLATGAGKVLSTLPNLISQGLEAAGHGDAAQWVQENITHHLANPVQLGDAIEGISPTPDTTAGHANRFIGELVGSAVAFPQAAAEKAVAKLVGEVPKAVIPSPKPAPITNDAKEAGVRVLTSDVRPPRTFIGKSAQAIGERIPIAGTGAVREAQQAERIAAVKNIAREHGIEGDALTSPLVDEVAKDLAKTRGAMLDKFTAQKNAVIEGIPGAVPAPQTISAIDAQIARLNGINSDAYAPVISKLKTFRDQLGSGKTLSQIEGNRKLLGDMFADPNLASIRGDGEKAINALYDPLRSDMGAFIKANGEKADYAKWKSANAALSDMAGQLKNRTLKTALSTADTTPENVARLLFSTKPSDVRLLYNGLSAEGKAKAQAAVIQRAIEKSGGLENISPDRFASQIHGMGKQVGILFGENSARLNGLARVLKMTQRASQASVAPPTGVQAVPYAMAAGFTELFGLYGGIAAAAGTGLLARAYESAPVRNILLKLGRTKAGSSQERVLLKRAGVALNAAMQKHVPEAANSNTLASAAAQPQENDQNQ